MSGRRRGAGHGASSLLFVLVLFAAMLLIGVMLIVMGTGVYENVLTSMDENDEYRTASAYIVQKTRQAGTAGAVSAGELDGCDAIVIRERIGGETYLTYLYCDDGALKELLVREGNESLSAAAGSEVLALRSMTVRGASTDTAASADAAAAADTAASTDSAASTGTADPDPSADGDSDDEAASSLLVTLETEDGTTQTLRIRTTP